MIIKSYIEYYSILIDDLPLIKFVDYTAFYLKTLEQMSLFGAI